MNSVNSSSSEVGEVVDVATPSRKKPLAWGVLMIGVGAAWLVGAAFAFREGGTGATIGGAFLGLLAYFLFAFALFRFRIAARTDWYLRAGRGGLSIHVPNFALASFVGGYGTIRRDMRWSDVKNWGPEPEKPGAFLSDRVSEALAAFLMVELNDGSVLNLSTVAFAETQFQVADNIRRVKE